MAARHRIDVTTQKGQSATLLLKAGSWWRLSQPRAGRQVLSNEDQTQETQ